MAPPRRGGHWDANVTSNLTAKIAAAWPPEQWRDVTVLLAVSGGADSVALLRAVASLAEEIGLPVSGGRLIAAHFNHRLRGEEADADQQFVVDLSARLGIPCEVGQAELSARHAAVASEGRESRDPSPPAPSASDRSTSEQSARAARYDFLCRTAQRLGARYVATAHTADDQAETILHRILRGTGLAGLAGIPAARKLVEGIALVRPMLGVSRGEVRSYLAELGQPHREDASNRLSRYTRNRLRNDLLPRLEEYNPAVAEALVRLGRLAGEAQTVLEATAAAVLDRAIVAQSAETVTLDRGAFRGQSRYVVREAFVRLWHRQAWPRQAYGLIEWEMLAELALRPLAAGEALHRTLPGGVRAHASDDRLTLKRT